MTCKFYGCAAVPARRFLITIGGNRCALTGAACQMEVIEKQPPVLENCGLVCSRQALDRNGFERRELVGAFK